MQPTRHPRSLKWLRARRAACSTLAALAVLLAGSSASPCLAEENGPPAAAPQAESHIQEALFQEIYGQNDARQALLEAALEESPNSAEARWQLGQVQVGRDWLPLDAAANEANNSEVLAEYAQRREACPETAADHEELARWCARQNLHDRERLHWQIVLSLDPENEAAVRQLGLVRHNGQWVTRQHVEAEEELAKRLERADRQWRPVLAGYRRAIQHGTTEERDTALAQLSTVDDVWAIPTLEDIFSCEGGELAEMAVEVLSRIKHPWATESLVRHAVLADSEPAREAAIAQLKALSPFEYVPTLLDELVAPVEAEFTVMVDPNGSVNLRRWLHREDRDAVYTTTFDESLFLFNHVPSVIIRDNQNTDGSRSFSFRNNRVARAAVQQQVYSQAASAAAGQQQVVAAAEAEVDQYNQVVDAWNGRIIHVLAEASGQAEIAQPLEWWQWWDDYNEVAYIGEKQRVEEYAWQHAFVDYAPAGTEYTSSASPLAAASADGSVSSSTAARSHGACFIAGTKVWTEQGLQAIETIQIGDRVLSQDVDTGELVFKIVTGCTVRPPTEVVSVVTSSDTLVSTPAHLFWVNGEGWRKARELRSGDLLHATDGAEFVSEVVPDETPQAVFNLIVEDHHNYFVGESRILVHDVTTRAATRAIVPGLVSE